MDYKGFYIDTDSCDHSVTVMHIVLDIQEVFGNIAMAKAFVDGYMKCLQSITHSH